MGGNQGKVSVISTHMPVRGWGIFNKGIQNGDLVRVRDLSV